MLQFNKVREGGEMDVPPSLFYLGRIGKPPSKVALRRIYVLEQYRTQAKSRRLKWTKDGRHD